MVIKWFRLMLCLFYFPFDITVEVILRRIYNNNEVVHFTFNGKTYVQL